MEQISLSVVFGGKSILYMVGIGGLWSAKAPFTAENQQNRIHGDFVHMYCVMEI